MSMGYHLNLVGCGWIYEQERECGSNYEVKVKCKQAIDWTELYLSSIRTDHFNLQSETQKTRHD